MDSLTASQLICMAGLLLLTFVQGISPVLYKKTPNRKSCLGKFCEWKFTPRRQKLFMSFMIYFSGGLLLGICLLHLLPESRERFDKHMPRNQGSNNTEHGNEEISQPQEFRLPELIVCCGFFAAYLLEEIVHHFLGDYSHLPSETRAFRYFSRSNPFATIHRLRNPDSDESSPPSSAEEVPGPSPNELSLVRLLIVAALSFQSLFEGIALGLRLTIVSTWIVYAALLFHKLYMSYVLSLELVARGVKNVQVCIYVAVFSLVTPVGMTVAIIMRIYVQDSSPVAVCVLNSLAVGALLYVTFIVILHKEENKDTPTRIQLIASISGFALSCLYEFIMSK